jgi:predicted  nucleic acid-binding Zn-ribbon protein
MTQPDDTSGLPISDRMQALLARAAEDQLSEQRQLAEALTDLRAQMQHVTDDVAALRDQIERDDRVDSAVGTVSAEVREAVRLIGERLDGLARMVHQRGLDLAELRGSFAELRSTVAAHGESLTGLTGGLDSIPSYGERVSALQETVAALSDRLSGLDDVRSAVADVDNRVGATADALAEVRRSLEVMRQRAGSLAASDDLEVTSTQVSALAERIEELAVATAPLAERLTAVQQSVELESERSGRLAEQLTDLAGRLDEAAANASTARGDSEALTQRLEALQEDVTAIGGNVAGLVESGPDPAELSAALEAARNAGDEMGRVNEMAVQIAEVRAALLGDEGLEAQFAQLSERVASLSADPSTGLDEQTQAAVTDAVAREVAASEQRLSRHLDEAVLALADVLLRRRGRSGGGVNPAALGDFWAPTAAESGLPAMSAPAADTPELLGETAPDGDAVVLPDAEGAAGAGDSEASGWFSDDGDDVEQDDVPAPWDRMPDAQDAGETDAAAAGETDAGETDAGETQEIQLPESAGVTAAPSGEWSATAESEVTVEEPKRKRRPWWRPGD